MIGLHRHTLDALKTVKKSKLQRLACNFLNFYKHLLSSQHLYFFIAQYKMPRELITIQTGQCGNQSKFIYILFIIYYLSRISTKI